MIKMVIVSVKRVLDFSTFLSRQAALTRRNNVDTVNIKKLTMDTSKQKISRVAADGRTVVDLNKLVRDPQVQRTLKKISDSLSGSKQRIRILRRASATA